MYDPPAVFEKELQELADLAKALAHPGRLRILQILAQEQTCICGEIVNRLPFSQSTVSQHLRELKRVGLIQGKISGPCTCYCLDPDVIRVAQEKFSRLFAGINCCRLDQGETHEL